METTGAVKSGWTRTLRPLASWRDSTTGGGMTGALPPAGTLIYNDPVFVFFADAPRFLALALPLLRRGESVRGSKGFTNASSKVKTFLKSLGESVSFLPSTPA